GALALSWWWWAAGASALGLQSSLLPGRLPQFLFGALVGIAVRERSALVTWAERWSRPLLHGSVAALVATGIWFGAHGTHHRRAVLSAVWLEPITGVLLAGILLAVVVRAGLRRPSALTHPVLRGAGLVSYSLYLWHYPILLLCLRHFD